MSRIVHLLFFLALVNICSAQTWIDIDLEETEYVNATDKTCIKKTGEPLNGRYAIKFNRYQTNYESFIDGLKNGEAKVFRNRKLAEKGLYKNNLKEGEWIYYTEDGAIRKRIFFQNGKIKPISDLQFFPD
ncbi:MAG: toxin-antitoxin system YwqK family antitoxin [Sphingobacterium sp.]